MPSARTVHRWLIANADFRQQYALARDVQTDMLAEEALEIVRRADKDTANAARVHLDGIRWFTGQVNPKKWGARQTHEVELSANDRLLALIEQGMARAGSR